MEGKENAVGTDEAASISSKKAKKAPEKSAAPNPAEQIDHLLDHTPMLDSCKWCQMAKTVRKGAYRKRNEPDNPPKQFGDIVCADHLVAEAPHSQGLNVETDALVIGHRWSEWIWGYPVKAREANKSYACFLGPSPNVYDIISIC